MRGSTFLERARRDQLVLCAIDSLAENGFAATSVAEVSRRAGISKSVVLYHFASKRDLLEAVVDTVYAEAGDGVVTAMAAARGDRETLAGYVRECVLFALRNANRVTAVGEIVRNLKADDGRARYTAADSEELVGGVIAILDAGRRSGVFADFDSRIVAAIIRSIIDAVPGVFGFAPSVDAESVADEVVAAVARMTDS